MINESGKVDYEQNKNSFDDDQGHVRNHSFKQSSPLSFQQSENQKINQNVNGYATFVNETLNRNEIIRSRRTSTPPFSTEFGEIEYNTPKNKLNSVNSQTSVASSNRSASTNSSPKISSSKRSSSNFIKKLSFKFKSSSHNSNEKNDLNDKKSNYSNKYGSSTSASTELSTMLPCKTRTVTASTQTIEMNKENYTSNFNKNENAKNESADLDLEAMKKVFNVFDSDHDGSITIEDVEKVMNSLQNLKNEIDMPSVDQIKIAFDKFDANKNGSIEFEEFLEILRCAGVQSDPNSSIESNDHAKTTKIQSKVSKSEKAKMNTEHVKTNMRIMFEQFDKDNDGKITKPELNFVMQNLFPDEVITDSDIEDMLRAADLDKNGFIDFDEFANMFMLHSTNNAIRTNSIESSFTNPNNIDKVGSRISAVTNLKLTESLNRSNKSLSKTISRSSSKEERRSRNPSGQPSDQQSPSKYKKFVQLFTASQMMDLKAAFHMFDKNGDQKISEKELYEVMKYLGVSATEKDVKAMIQVVDINKNGCVDYDEFIQMMTKTQLKPLSQEEELRKTFNIFDIDGNGFISHDEIKKTMTHLGENISDEEVRDMIKAADKNGDGKIDINEFSGLLNGTNVFKSPK